MEHDAPAIFAALEHSAFAAAIRQSSWLYPLANVGHILALVAFASAVAVMDLRILGAFAGTVPAHVLRQARRAAILAFCGLAATGFMLFSAEASHIVVNPVFRLKAALVAALIFECSCYKVGHDTDWHQTKAPHHDGAHHCGGTRRVARVAEGGRGGDQSG